MKKSFYLGVGLFAICFFLSFFPELLPENLPPTAIRMLGVTFLIAVFWLAETIPIPATSIIPLFLLPLLGILASGDVASAYGSDIILLFMTGFFIATAIEKWNLHRRIALHIIKLVGTQPTRLILGFMIATAALSMWISNAATTLMMLPIATAAIEQTEVVNPKSGISKTLGTGLMLGIAYGANIGGMGTPIGTPPNLVFLAQIEEAFPTLPSIAFLQWMIVGVPLVIIFILLTWLYLTKVGVKLPREFSASTDGGYIDEELKKIGKMSQAEKYVAILFALTAFLWIFRSDITIGSFTLTGWATYLGVSDFVKDTTVGAMISVIMFLLPVKTEKGKQTKLIDWSTAVKIPWGILLLFGGGIAISKGFEASGLSQFFADNLQTGLQGLSIIVSVVIVCIFMTFLTEFTSNTAVTTLMMPIFATIAPIMQVNPHLLMWPAALSASCAFMMPVATAPNAIVYSQNYFTIATMAKTGLILNLIGVILVSLLINFVAIPMLN
ncbi:DASS family sodium-coupled anion symporter [Pleurocapsa sp. PCC 7319]|uniref:SLC13 family permease n=1 Tax=Pleurocapsa sp. PCC 7319 TaxID=118161 RepID=UPI000347AE92|nr:DASS family sodium-coupled anion symporter [Pleurocapsa sp. PCC 7319]